MHPIEQVVADFLDKYQLEKAKTLIIGVSGGADSVALLHALHNLKKQLLVVHVNYNLRGQDALADETFVAALCKKRQIECKIIKADAKQKKGAVQLWARELRYKHFRAISKKTNNAPIFTAHHAGDQAETVLLNLIGGTGIKGITGIKEAQNGIYRPFLSVKKEDLYNYLKLRNEKYREDASNKQNKYSRNRIRNLILPELEKINSSAQDNIVKTANNLQATKYIANIYLHNIKQKLLDKDSDIISINIQALKQFNPDANLLYLLLEEFAVNADICTNLLHVFGATEPKTFYTKSHKILVQRGYFYISPIKNSKRTIAVFKDVESWAAHPHFLVKKLANTEIKNSQSAASEYFDVEELKFPITYRPWQTGDRILLNKKSHHKKVAAILTDKKIPQQAKGSIFVLEDNNNKILWICGIKRAAEAWIKPTTKKTLFVKLLKPLHLPKT